MIIIIIIEIIIIIKWRAIYKLFSLPVAQPVELALPLAFLYVDQRSANWTNSATKTFLKGKENIK